jgi:hypothetical protein
MEEKSRFWFNIALMFIAVFCIFHLAYDWLIEGTYDIWQIIYVLIYSVYIIIKIGKEW